MKKCFVLILTVFIANNMQAQTVDGKKIEDLDAAYLQIEPISKGLGGRKISIMVDYGQPNGKLNDRRVLDEDGDPVIFNSMTDALNFFDKHGYEYIDAVSVPGQGGLVLAYNLKKKKPATKE